MTDTTSNALEKARLHADSSWQMFTREKGLSDTRPEWRRKSTPDGGLLLSGRLVGSRAVWALNRFARDFYMHLGAGDVYPQFDIHQPGRTVLVWRRDGVWVELWHPDTVVDAPTPVEPVQSASVPPPVVQAVPEPAAAPAPGTGRRRALLGPGGRLTFTRNRRTTNDKETNPA